MKILLRIKFIKFAGPLAITVGLLASIFYLKYHKQQEYEWVFVYYMSYDNNLTCYGRTILEDLGNGVTDSKIAVVVQADFHDIEGMKRISLNYANGNLHREDTTLESENSADESEYRKYLEWVRENWNSKNYAVIFLDHGGTLNNMCLDEHPFKDDSQNSELTSSEKWLNAAKVGQITAAFNQDVDGKVQLLFLQQCGRGSLQNIYSFVNSAKYIMASPFDVGAPNTYYTEMLKFVTENPNVTGARLAQNIMEQDQDYVVYTLVENNELEKLPEKLNALSMSLQNCDNLAPLDSLMPTFQSRDERNYDVKFLFQGQETERSNDASQAVSQFLDWYENELIVKKSVGPYYGSPQDYSSSGLSLHVPSNKETVERYGFLPLYQQTNLASVLDLMVRCSSQ